MKPQTITVIPGEGIGREIMAAAIRVIDALGLPITWDYRSAGLSAKKRNGRFLPQDTIASIKRNRVVLKGPTATPMGKGHRSINVKLREQFDLYANVRPVHTMPGVKTLFHKVNIVVFRENTEDLYIGKERYVDSACTIAEAVSRITKEGSRRIAQYAFEYAREHKRRKVTVVHKANILKKTHGLFLSVARRTARKYSGSKPKIKFGNMLADTFMMQLVRDPKQFDCVLLPNFLGDLASDLCAGLIGGLGFAPSANIGKNCAIFEAVHGTAPDIKGKGIANPAAIIMAGALMLDYLGKPKAARRINTAIECVLAERICVTADVNPRHCVSTNAFADAVIAKLL